MGIIVGKDTRLVVQGITGREGSFHALNNRTYGTNVVAGVTPGKAGQDVEGIPVFNTVRDAVEATQANTSLIFVPPRFAVDAIYEAVDAGIKTIICITEGIPAHDMMLAYGYVKDNGVTLVGPNCPGVCTVGEANVGIMPSHIFTKGTVGLVSRSGTLTYQLGKELTDMGIGQSTILGIGGDPIVGTNHRDALAFFEADPGTDMIVMVGEIGGDEEELAAAYIKDHVTKPVIGYIAGLTAPEGKQMGHAGAIISGNAGTAQGKVAALEAAGVKVGKNPTEVAALVAEARGVAVPA
ncbi:MAG: succinate--CoA ligase subunit alpha [Thermoleophilia bacterium]|nr:succinate--CoA ligase subunit alpha [Thermoleophilia bacterium]